MGLGQSADMGGIGGGDEVASGIGGADEVAGGSGGDAAGGSGEVVGDGEVAGDGEADDGIGGGNVMPKQDAY